MAATGGALMQTGQIYDAILDEGAFAALPGLIAGALGGRSAVIHRYARDCAPQLCTNYFDGPFMADVLDSVVTGNDIWTQAGMATGILNRAVAMHRIVPDTDFRGSHMWNEVFRKHGDDTGHSMGIIVHADDAVLCVSSQRAWRQGAYGAREEAVLDAMQADLHRLFQARELIGRQQAHIADLTDLASAGDEPALVVGPELEVRAASPAAEAILAADDGLRLRRGRLMLADRRAEAGVQAAVRAAIGCLPDTCTAFVCGRPSGDEPWRLRVLPTGRPGARTCLILIERSEASRRQRQHAWLRDHYGVTDAEAAIAHALVAGLSLDEIADARAVSKHTVRAQLRALLSKAGVSRMAELVALLSRLP